VQPAADGADARGDLARAERLGDVVVAAQFQPDDAIHLVGAGGQEQHGHIGMPAQGAADVEAGHVRQADVEDDEIDGVGRQPAQRLATQRAAIDGKTLGAQGVAQGIGNGRFVVDDEDFHARMIIHLVRIMDRRASWRTSACAEIFKIGRFSRLTVTICFSHQTARMARLSSRLGELGGFG
jgi:hypothetical protein